MHAVAVISSRNRDGKTAAATNSLLRAMESEGVTTEAVILPEMKIESCRQCDFRGWGQCRTHCSCVIDDDFASIVERIRTADVVVFATPVYFSDLSESMRSFTDRLRRISVPHTGDDHVNLNFIPAIGICNAGGGGGGSEQCAMNLQGVLSKCGFEVVDMVPVRRQNMEFKLQSLALLGRWLPEYIASGEWERVIPSPSHYKRKP